MKTATGVLAVPHLLGSRIDLAWQNPPASDFDGGQPLLGIRIVRQERTFPLAPDDGKTIHLETQPLVSQYTDDGLQPLTTYYYTIFAMDTAGMPYADDHSRTAAFATANYNLSERLYRLLPAVHQRDDVPGATMLQKLDQTTVDALNALPPNLQGMGQLRRFFYAAVAPADLMRSFAEGLSLLQNVDLARPEFLPLLAQWLGWELDRTLPIFAQRNEIKFAPRLYRAVGTIPNLQAIVTRYTGWYAQVAEFVQNIALSNVPPQFNIFAIMQTPDGGWPGTDDAAPVFNFVPSVKNVLTDLISTVKGPFALRAGMELSLITDSRIPVVMRFQPGDFVDITQATAAEVANVLNRLQPDVRATASQDGTIELNSLFSIQIDHSPASLVTLEGAPGGRLSTVVGKVGRFKRTRLFYETANPLDSLTALNASQATGGGLTSGEVVPGGTQQTLPCGGPVPALVTIPSLPITPTILPSLPQGRVHYKTYRSGGWGESYPLPLTPSALAQKDPAAVELPELPDGRIWVAWIDVVNPNTDGSMAQPLQYHLRFALGTVSAPQPALLRGQAREPFTLRPGTHLLFRGNWPGREEGFEFAAHDFVHWQQASAVEVVAALNACLGNRHVTASLDPVKRTLLLTTVDSGGDKFLEVDLQSSSAAQALGFNSENNIASGDWGDAIVKWSPPQEVTSATTGLNTDLHAVVASGIVWLFWASYDGPTSNWRIVDSRWDGKTWSPLEVVADGLGGNREPYAILDDNNHIWLFWSRRQGVSTLQDNWTLEYRVFDGAAWGPETPLTSTPTDGDGRAADREPAAVLLPNGDLQVFFRSDRRSTITDITDGLKLWSVTITPSTRTIVPPGVITTDYNADYRPAPILMPDGKNTLWLLFRSDRSVSLSGIATRSLPTQQNRITDPAPVMSAIPTGPLLSTRAPGTGTLRRYAGSTSVFLSNVARNSRLGLWDDLLAYTPQKPQGDQPLGDSDYYTRGTLGLYLNQVTPDSPLSQQRVDRLRPVLERFLPINVRALVILSPPPFTEYVYQTDPAVGPTVDIQESYQDNYPFVEYYDGPKEDRIAAALPDWAQLRSNTLSDVSASATDLTTLRHRTYFPPPQ